MKFRPWPQFGHRPSDDPQLASSRERELAEDHDQNEDLRNEGEDEGEGHFEFGSRAALLTPFKRESHLRDVPHRGKSTGVDAVPLARRVRPIVEDVAKVPPARTADNFEPRNAHGKVSVDFDVFGDSVGEARPTRTRIKLRVRHEQRGTAPAASIGAVVTRQHIGPGKRPLSALSAKHPVLLGRQGSTPLSTRFLDRAGRPASGW